MHIEHLDAESERLWAEESARRAAEYDAGTVQGVSGKIAAVNPRIKTEYLSAEFVAAYNQTLEEDGLPFDEWRAF